MSLFKTALQILRRAGHYIFFSIAISMTVDQWITLQMQDRLSSPEGAGPMIWLYGLLSLTNSLIFPLFCLTIILLAIKSEEKNLFFVTIHELNQVLIESLRSWGKALSWSFLFIVPGIIKWLKFSFTPYVTLLSDEYRRGEVDALELSEQASHGKLLKILALLILFAIVLPLILTIFDEYKIIWKTPLPALALVGLETVTTVVFTLLMRSLFLKKYVC